MIEAEDLEDLYEPWDWRPTWDLRWKPVGGVTLMLEQKWRRPTIHWREWEIEWRLVETVTDEAA